MAVVETDNEVDVSDSVDLRNKSSFDIEDDLNALGDSFNFDSSALLSVRLIGEGLPNEGTAASSDFSSLPVSALLFNICNTKLHTLGHNVGVVVKRK